MEPELVGIAVRIEILNATVVRHFRDCNQGEINTLKTGLEVSVCTNASYPRYIVISGQHELDSIMTALGGDEPLLLVVTHPESEDELPFDIK